MSELIHSDHVYKSSWRQPEDIDRYLRERIEGYSLNVCVGESPLGDVTLDMDKSHNPDVIADMNSLPFPDSTFETVIFDPPWKMGYFKRQKPFFECVRVTETNGLILANMRWVGESQNTQIEDTVVRADDEWANISVIVSHRKQSGQTGLGEYE